MRVRKAVSPTHAASRSASPPAPCALAPDSLAQSLLLAARVIALVQAGQSLTQALTALSEAPAAARAAAQDLAYGTLRRYGSGEFILARLLERALPHAEVEALLRAALYRLQTRPESAYMVVDQAVAAAGELASGAFKGLVNGVLRNYLRQRDALQVAMAADDEVAQQHPRWWLSRLRRAYPECWQEIVAVGNSQPPMTLRVNRRRVKLADYMARLQEVGLAARSVGGDALMLDKPVSVDSLPGFADGLVSIQDAGAQRAARILGPLAGQRILDACAAPGGKSGHLLEIADIDLLALDIDGSRTQRVEDNLRRLGLSATVRAADCRATDQWWDGQPFDAILADVPCSASGVVRRHPDIKYLRRESDIRSFARQQAAILDRLWPLVKPGGKMLYATCSVFPEENGAQIDAFLVRQPAARQLAEERLLPQEEHDGFFYALLRKTV
ncbi:MAG: 16S rRNA (cytosine(967)-C(5))-methyltransferase RsmB [Candidatus Accumulibacter sp.]|jgi:16S rRNA (cytosine967-C5)-methyltransferase|uniref:16S rRNA (cytosine(967)-C(5))-methyltransferase n=1 Tax=Candidatus Accumulibacter affinis TaxID=2954384 RepID=A0A935T9F3_9PROT|nr:16S rRNA (cytosine(967)-C(5))-methyltransferase RsmB [Candidatus Accumulibacter affinis]MBP9804535.1 16S rRNA (cytosine(967)-C(5))-methyltransferase RsmB [Accumulibacter sp.]